MDAEKKGRITHLSTLFNGDLELIPDGVTHLNLIFDFFRGEEKAGPAMPIPGFPVVPTLGHEKKQLLGPERHPLAEKFENA